LLGWNVTIVTTDGHAIWHNSTKSIMEAPIKIGNHVWLGAYVKVGKGVCLPDDCVVAQSSLVTKQFNSPHTLIGGVPAKEISKDITWNID
jgi:acetyltransferase-like isoleucine patch superfamily enzyme